MDDYNVYDVEYTVDGYTCSMLILGTAEEVEFHVDNLGLGTPREVESIVSIGPDQYN
jgi:hypothetical protein